MFTVKNALTCSAGGSMYVCIGGRNGGMVRHIDRFDRKNIMQIEYGNYKFDTEKLPASSVSALFSRGLAHYLGNEQAAKVSNWEKTLQKEWEKASPLEPFVGPSDEEKAQKKTELVEAAIKVLEAGEIGQGRGPAKDPLEALMWGIAKDQMTTLIRAHGAKVPRAEKDDVEFADGSKQPLEALIQMRLDAHKDAITKDAQKKLAEAERNRKRIQDEAKAKGSTALTLEALGL